MQSTGYDASFAMGEPTSNLTIRTTASLIERIRAAATSRGVSMNVLCVEMLERGLDQSDADRVREDSPPFPALTGYALADLGGTIVNEDVRWVQLFGPTAKCQFKNMVGPGTAPWVAADLRRLLDEGLDLDGQIVLYPPEDDQSPVLVSLAIQHSDRITIRATRVHKGGQWIRRLRQSFNPPAGAFLE